MLQRIQTVLMSFIVISTIILFFVPIFSFKNSLGTITLNAFTTEINLIGTQVATTNNFLIGIIALFAIVITIYSILSFKNRALQLKLSLLTTVIYLGLLASMIYYQSYLANNYSKYSEGGKYGLGFFVPAICLILNMISSRFIRKDEKMVKDAFERLR